MMNFPGLVEDCKALLREIEDVKKLNKVVMRKRDIACEERDKAQGENSLLEDTIGFLKGEIVRLEQDVHEARILSDKLAAENDRMKAGACVGAFAPFGQQTISHDGSNAIIVSFNPQFDCWEATVRIEGTPQTRYGPEPFAALLALCSALWYVDTWNPSKTANEAR